jgi:tetratricopeptide (TPR) repeat protein
MRRISGTVKGTLPAPRLRLHPLLRAYAHDLWAQQSAHDRHAHSAALLTAIGTYVEHHRHDFPTVAIEEELIVAAARHAADHTEHRHVIALVERLFDYIFLGGHWRAGVDLLHVQRTACRAVGDRAGEGTTLNNLGLLANRLGRQEEARQYYEQALIIRREVGDRAGEGVTLCSLGDTLRATGQVMKARALIEQARAIFEQVGSPHGIGTCSALLGRSDETDGDTAGGIAHYRAALQRFEQVGSPAAQTMREDLRRLGAGEA